MTPVETLVGELSTKAAAEEIARRAVELVANDDDFETNVADLANDYEKKVTKAAGVLARLLSDKPSRADIAKRALARVIDVGLPVVVGVGVSMLAGPKVGALAASVVVGGVTASKVSREVAKTRGEAAPSWAGVTGRIVSLVFDVIKLINRKGKS